MVWRYALAIVLSILILFGWSYFNPPAPPRQLPPVPAPQPRPAEGAAPNVPGAPAPQPGVAAAPPRERKTLPVEIDGRYQLVFDSRGGCIQRALLKEFHESVETTDPYLAFQAPDHGPGIFTLEVEDPVNPARPSRIPFDANWELERTSAEGAPPVVELRYNLDSVAIKKTVEVGGPDLAPPGAAPESWHLKVTVELANTGAAAVDFVYRLYGPVGIDTEEVSAPGADIELVHGAWSGESVSAQPVAASSLAAPRDFDAKGLAWVGLNNTYFTGLLFPLPVEIGRQSPFVDRGHATPYADPAALRKLALDTHQRALDVLTPAEVQALREKAFKNLGVALRSVKISLPAGGAPVRHQYGLFLGPRTKQALASYTSIGLDKANHYGYFDVVVRFFIWLLGLLNVVAFGSWGVAIILLTFLVKLCLHPINKRTQASMQRFQKQMERIKPEMDAIRERYSSDRKRMNLEIQRLWRENKVNPLQQMGGCMIMFLQLPIWLALLNTLKYDHGLRQAPFLYVEDLTRPDMLFNLGFTIPILGTPWFNLLPLIYMVVTVVSQRMQPKPTDPQMRQQYNMMTFMMVFFGFIFYSFAAGFLVYVTTSALLGIVESKIIKAELRREEARLAASGAAGAAGTVIDVKPMYSSRPRKQGDEQAKRGRRS